MASVSAELPSSRLLPDSPLILNFYSPLSPRLTTLHLVLSTFTSSRAFTSSYNFASSYDPPSLVLRLALAVEFEYHGDPIDAKHCHCTQCQRLHGAPFQWAALFHKTSVRLAKHCDPLNLDFFSTQEGHSEHSVPCKISCRNCRSPMADEGRNMVMA